MYPDVAAWLRRTMETAFRGKAVAVEVTGRLVLWRFLQQRGWHGYFPDYATFDIRTDVTGIVHSETAAQLAFVECKLGPIRLRDISQLLGYSRVAKPVLAYIVSPAGISTAVRTLLVTHRRFDVVEYDAGKRIRVATWNRQRQEIDHSTLLPPGAHSL